MGNYYQNFPLSLPDSVVAKVELGLVEDFILYALREKLPDIPIFSLIPEDPPEVFINVRKVHMFEGSSDSRTDLGWARFSINTFTHGINGDVEGALLQEAVRVSLREAWTEQMHVPGLGWIKHIALVGEPSREADWATSAGPVQYADLPTGHWRYEGIYVLKFRREQSQRP